MRDEQLLGKQVKSVSPPPCVAFGVSRFRLAEKAVGGPQAQPRELVTYVVNGKMVAPSPTRSIPDKVNGYMKLELA
jgi:hypothetical protein